MTKKVALDSMCFIYHFEQTLPYFSHIETIFSQSQSGKSEIITSIISVLETLSAPKYLTRPEVVGEINLFFLETGYITVFDINWEIAQEAASLRREFKFLRAPDSIQLATATIYKAQMFVTNDKILANLKIPGLKINSLSNIL